LSKKFWEELIVYFLLIWHGPHRKRSLKQFFYCCICVRCLWNVFTEPLPSNDKGIDIQTHRQQGGLVRLSLLLFCSNVGQKWTNI
jgi:hypothetical protein